MLPYEGMSKANVRKLRDMRADAPEAANFGLKQISALFSWAVKEEHAKVNPAEGVERIANASEGFYTWTEQDVLAFERIIRSEQSRALPWRSFSGLA